MEAKKLTVNQAKNLVNGVKAIYRLNGFETGMRTNLRKATKECKFDYAELGKGIDASLSFPESVFEKEYQIEVKARFSNSSDWYEIWFEDSKCYLFQMYETKYLIVSGLEYCNVYRLIEKTESEKFEDQPAIVSNGDSKKAVLDYNDKKKDMKTKYIYKGKEILQSTFISLCRKIGVNGGRKFTTLEKLQQEANKGNKKAIELLSNLQIQ